MMVSKVNLPNRVAKANAAVRFAKVLNFDAKGYVKAVVLPGSDGKRYHVILRRTPHYISAELNVDTGHGLTQPPYPPLYVTYHMMAAVQIAADAQNHRVKWCANAEDAMRLARIEGMPFRLVNFRNYKAVQWGVYV
jgi:hypothetical protein